MHVALDVHEELEIFVELFGMLLHELLEGGSLDIVHGYRPAAVHNRYCLYLGDIEVGLFNARLVKGFI